MVKTINFSDFRDAFLKHERENQFSYSALRALFDYCEQWEIDSGQAWELDVIELCCDFVEMTIDVLIDSYSIDVSDATNESERHAIVSDYLTDNTILVSETDNNSYLFAQF